MIAHTLPLIFGAAAAAGALFASAALALRLRRGHGISILIPFRAPSDKDNARIRNVSWLKQYWIAQLPGAEVIIGEDPHTDFPFSKSVAVNNAVSKATGDVFVIVDADGYIGVDAVLHCVKEIRSARRKGKKLWFVPYRQFYRLTEEASKYLLDSDPAKPHKFSTPLSSIYIMNDTDPKVGHWYGAMIQIMPREAFEQVGGWDERFRGWGGEDHAAMRAMDTLYTLHKTLPGQVLHVWHPQLSPDGQARLVNWKNRMWEGQQETGVNNKLSHRYYAAQNRPEMMRKLVDESRTGDSPSESSRSKSDKKRRTSI
jgi:hypothetical protein